MQVSVIGASIAGLISAKELAEQGIDVTVFEEHREIGIPEKCDGLVSTNGLSQLGIIPPAHVVQNSLTKARFFSPAMKEVEIDARKQGVVVLDRSRFDKHLAERAARAGAKIELGKRVTTFSQTAESVSLSIDSEKSSSEILLDCSGYEGYIRNGGETLQGAQYVVFGKWFDKSTVEVYLDPKEAPGFFKWVIPISSDVAKIGVAGTGINTFAIMDRFVKERDAVPLRKSAAPVACTGAIKKFVDRRVGKVGDSAGMAKPTSGGGIYTGGYGGLLAGRAAADAIHSHDISKLEEYESSWKSRFGNEFRLQLYARNMFAKLDAKKLDQLMEMISSSDVPRKIAEEGDFDMHSVAIIKTFGLSNLFSTLGMVVTSELKSLIA